MNKTGKSVTIAVVSALVLTLGSFLIYQLVSKDGKEDEKTEESVVADSNDDDKDEPKTDPEEGKKEEAKGPTEAQLMGFAKGVKEVEFGYEAGYGYSYEFDRDGNLTTINMMDHGYSGKITWRNGKAIKNEGEDAGFGDEDKTEPEKLFVTYEYRENGAETEIYTTLNSNPPVKIGTLYYDEDGRIIRAENEDGEQRFTYDADGRARNQDGEDVYPPLKLFFYAETPLLPRDHKVIKADDEGRPLKADSEDGFTHYNISYYDD